MTCPIVAFFNNKAGVGTTSLVYHLAWMFADQGRRVLAADLDPQANLTAAFLEDERLEQLWPEGQHPETLLGSLEPLLRGIGDIQTPHVEQVERIGLVVGDLALSAFEDELSSAWPECMDQKTRGFRVVSAFWRLLEQAAKMEDAQVILVDVGPNLGAINRAALVAADFVVVPLAPDIFSLQGLRILGPTLRTWRTDWHERIAKNPDSAGLCVPAGCMRPLGYVVVQHGVRLDRPDKSYDTWIHRIPDVYRQAVLDEPSAAIVRVEQDPHCLTLLRHYHSLTLMAREAHKPMFFLKPADGAIGAHLSAVHHANENFAALARRIEERIADLSPKLLTDGR